MSSTATLTNPADTVEITMRDFVEAQILGLTAALATAREDLADALASESFDVDFFESAPAIADEIAALEDELAIYRADLALCA